MLTTVLVLVVTVLTVPPSGVPAIAEIAPQAVKQIMAPPPEQQGNVGNVGGDGKSGTGTVDKTRTTQQDEKSKIEVARIKHCVGDPPRQIEDPQSPPCVPYWDPNRDNGGATAPGVTRDEIRIAVPGGGYQQNIDLENFFNARFTFYGRSLRLVDTSADRKQDDSVQDQINAANNAKALGVFASSDYWYAGGVIYNRELARHRIIGVSYQSVFTEAELRTLAPYVWQYPMATDRQLSVLGDWLCARVVPALAAHAGLDLTGKPRKLGLLVYDDWGVTVDARPLRDELARCGQSFATTKTIRAENANSDRTAFVDAVLQMKNVGVTSIVAVADSEIIGDVMQYASSNAYQPEWIVPTFTENEHVWIKRTYPADQAAHEFGLLFEPMHHQVNDDPWFWAVQADSGYGWDSGGNESSYSRQVFYQPLYRSLLLIASGIQMAGPRLTPETFERGLQRASFPNPKHPLMAGRVGFEGDTHSMTKDAAEWWWTPDVVGPYGPAGFQGQGAGTMCFIDEGKRRTFGTWPNRKDPFFKGACVSGEKPVGGGG